MHITYSSMAFDFFKRKGEIDTPKSPEMPKKSKKTIERALVAGTFLLNTGCSYSGLTVGQEAEKWSTVVSTDFKYDFVDNKTTENLEQIKKTKEFQRINDTIQRQGLSVDPLDLAAIFVHDKKDNAWKPMIKLSAWKSGTYTIGIVNPIRKLKEYGIGIEEFGEAIIATNRFLSEITGLTVVASLKPADTFMSIQGVKPLGEAFSVGESVHDDHVGDVVDNKGKYIDVLLKNAFKDIPGGFSSLIPESRKKVLKFVIGHEELHHLAFPSHIFGKNRSLMGAELPIKTEEVMYQGKKQYRAILPPDWPTTEKDPMSIICRGGIFPLFKDDIMKGRIEKLKK